MIATIVTTWKERWGVPGMSQSGRLLHEIFPRENRVAHTHANGIGNLDDALLAIEELCEEDDVNARARAYEIATNIANLVTLPDGTWSVFTMDMSRPEHLRRSVWSAHESEDEAKRWSVFWTEFLKGRTVQVGQLDDVGPHCLRRPGMIDKEIAHAVVTR